MNYLKYSETMKIAKKYGLLDKKDAYWQNLEISEGDSYYAIVKGRIPLEVAQIICEKYPDNEYGIRIHGNRDREDPKEWAIDEEYEIERDSYPHEGYISHFDIEKRHNSLQSNLKKRSDTNKYITLYHIDTKEGLLIFLSEMKDYFLRKNNLPETAVQKYETMLAETTVNILKKINPTISAYEWMQEDNVNKDDYNTVPSSKAHQYMLNLFRKTATEFDEAVNPFTDKNIKLDSEYNYIKKIGIEGSVYNSYQGKKRENCCNIRIYEQNKKNSDYTSSTEYYREPDGFSFILNYALSNTEHLYVLHYYTNNNEKGEVIAVNYSDYTNKDNNVDIRLNISNWKAGETYGKKEPATLEQISYVYDKLQEAITYARRITVDNMTKQNEKIK